VYLAAWDVRRAKLFGRCEPKSGIVPFERLIADVMGQQPYASANCVFWVVDNGSSHRGERASKRLGKRWPNVVLVHLPVHASWLNQIEIYFSILERKVLRPNNFDSLFALEDRILGFQDRYQANARPFQWKYTRADLSKFLAKLALDRAA
jgi:transposase